MDEAINDCTRGHRIREDLRPLLERKVGGDGDARALVTLRDNLEEQVCRFSFEWYVTEFVDEQKCETIDPPEPTRERSVTFCIEEAREQARCRRKHRAEAHRARIGPIPTQTVEWAHQILKQRTTGAGILPAPNAKGQNRRGIEFAEVVPLARQTV